MMPAHRMPTSVSVGLVLSPGARYDPSHHWQSAGGTQLNASVSLECSPFTHASIQGEPGCLRELAAALLRAAELAEQSLPTPATDPSDRDAGASVGGVR